VHTMNQDLDSVTKNKKWKEAADAILIENSFSAEFLKRFHAIWTVSGYHIREQIDDDEWLVKLLRHVLPPYSAIRVPIRHRQAIPESRPVCLSG